MAKLLVNNEHIMRSARIRLKRIGKRTRRGLCKT